MQLNFGPAHPAAHGVLRLVLQLDGEVRKPIVQALFLNTDFRKKLKLKTKQLKTQQIGRKFKRILQKLTIQA